MNIYLDFFCRVYIITGSYKMANLQDNIDEVEDTEIDEYLKMFDKIGALNDEYTVIKNAMIAANGSVARLQQEIKLFNKQDQINHETLSLLVKMNNIFGKSG